MNKQILNVILVTVAVTGLAGAEPKEGDWSNVTNLKSGTKVEVTQLNRKKVAGTVEMATPDGLALQTKKGEVKLTRADVQQVSTVSGSPRKRSLVAGAIGGPAAGAAVMVASKDPLHLSTGPISETPGGADVGAAVGALAGAPHVVYRKAK